MTRRFGSVRQLKSGRWQARYTMEGSDRKAPRTFRSRADADKWLRIKQTELDTGARLLARTPKRSTTLFGPYAENWIATRTKSNGEPLKDRTREHYRSLLQHQLSPTFGRRSLSAITADDVNAWHKTLASTPTLRAHAYGLMHGVMATAVQDQIIDANPCRIRGGMSSERRHTVNPPTLDELDIILDAMPERYRAMVLLAAWCGLRFGELAELRRQDIDGAVVRIDRAVVRVAGRMEVTTPKSKAGRRRVTMPPHITQAVRDHLAAMDDAAPDALLFPGAAGGHMQPSTLYTHWYKAREAAGRPDLRFHDLRHHGAVLAAQAGATLAELMARLGHSTVDAALRYQHAARGRDAEIAARLSEMAGGR